MQILLERPFLETKLTARRDVVRGPSTFSLMSRDERFHHSVCCIIVFAARVSELSWYITYNVREGVDGVVRVQRSESLSYSGNSDSFGICFSARRIRHQLLNCLI
jgi:hypothetical protein